MDMIAPGAFSGVQDKSIPVVEKSIYPSSADMHNEY